MFPTAYLNSDFVIISRIQNFLSAQRLLLGFFLSKI